MVELETRLKLFGHVRRRLLLLEALVRSDMVEDGPIITGKRYRGKQQVKPLKRT